MTRCSRWSAAAIALLGVVVASGALGQERLDPRRLDVPAMLRAVEDDGPEHMHAAAGIQQFQLLSSSLELEPVTLAELLALLGGTTADMGSWRDPASMDAVLPSVDPVVQREQESLWTARIRRSDLGDLVVQYELQGSDGTPGVLTSVASPASRIPTRIEDTEPLQVSANRSFVWLIGGARFFLSVGEARHAGTYSGTLTVTVNNL